jgi:hypothetical protein
MTPVYRKIHLHLYPIKIWVGYGESFAAIKDGIEKRIGIDVEHEIIEDWRALAKTVIGPNAVGIFLKPDPKLLCYVHHESVHAATFILDHLGIPISLENDETLCYLSGYIFGEILTFLKKQGAEI